MTTEPSEINPENVVVLEHIRGYEIKARKVSEKAIGEFSIDYYKNTWSYGDDKDIPIGTHRPNLVRSTGSIVGVYDMTNLAHLEDMIDVTITIAVKMASIDDRF